MATPEVALSHINQVRANNDMAINWNGKYGSTSTDALIHDDAWESECQFEALHPSNAHLYWYRDEPHLAFSTFVKCGSIRGIGVDIYISPDGFTVYVAR